MSQIINKLWNVDPNNSDAVKEALSPFFQQLYKHTETNSRLCLRALENVINRFPKYCMSQRGNIESYLAHFLDCPNYYIVIEAAKCALALQQVRPSQEKTATAKSCWRDSMIALCCAVHEILGAMFPNAVDIYQQTGKTLKGQQSASSPLATALSRLSSTTAIQNKALNKHAILNTRLRNVFVFIQAMLVEIYPVAKPIRPQTILDVIMRSLSVSSGNNAGHNAEDIVTVKTQALKTIDALVACLGPNLIPFSPLIFKFVMQTLKWCSDSPGEQANKVRCSAYSSLGTWLSCLRSHRSASERGKCWEDELTDHVLADITPRSHVVQLKMSSQPMKNLSKKARRKLANSMMMESNISSHMPGEKNKMAASLERDDEVMIAALECAETFFSVCGVFLKPTTYKRFQERLVRSCYSLNDFPPALALAFLRALEGARRSAPPTAPPHTQHAHQVYSSLHTHSTEIANFCARALLDIRMHLHCGPPSLNFALEAEMEKDTREEERKRQISERNRAALEQLLGPDKVPNQTEKEVVITIADEPSSKRRKIEDAEKISLSSDSDSVEIRDESLEEDDAVEEVQGDIKDAITEGTTDEEVVSIDEQDESEDMSEVDAEKEVRNGNINTIDITDDDIHNQPTQLNYKDNVSEDKIDSTQPDKESDNSNLKMPFSESIYEVETQLPPNAAIFDANFPVNISNDDEEEPPLSMEVAYDYPSTGKEKVAVLEKLEGDNLPSTNDTDDIQITCGQVVKNSQDADVDAKKTDVDAKNNEINEVKVNGVGDSAEKPLQNGEVTEGNVASKGLNVEEMLADFVDEVNEDTQVTQTKASQA